MAKQQKESGADEWLSYAELGRAGGRPDAGIQPDELTLRRFTNKEGKRPHLVIRIGHNIMEKAGLKVGDVVDLLVNADKSKALIKQNDKGWKLRKSGEKASAFVIPWGEKRLFDFMLKQATKLEHEASETGIAFRVPTPTE